MKKIMILLSSSLFLSSCFDSNDKTPEQIIQLGKSKFEANCSVCHGQDAQGIVEDWKKRLPDGSFPPPPLNGTAHTWHHSPAQLLRTIDEGGVALGGKMPGFKGKLNDAEKHAILDYLYSLWPADIKQRYDARFK